MSIHAHLYRRDGPNTSRKAAIKAGRFTTPHELRILRALRSCYERGGTYREIASEIRNRTLLPFDAVAVARRLKGMERKGMVTRGGERDGMTVWMAK